MRCELVLPSAHRSRSHELPNIIANFPHGTRRVFLRPHLIKRAVRDGVPDVERIEIAPHESEQPRNLAKGVAAEILVSDNHHCSRGHQWTLQPAFHMARP